MYALGIDLGTTWTAAAIWEDGRAETVPLGNRAHVIPSMVLVEPDGDIVVGEAAAYRRGASPSLVVVEFKKRFGDLDPYRVAGQTRLAERLTADLLGAAIATVTERRGAAPEQLVLTVPAHWDTTQKALLAEIAAEFVDSTRVSVVLEPVAAAIHYAGLTRVESGTTFAVYDLGGGTFDAAVIRKTDTSFAVVGPPAGDEFGGVDIDHALMQLVLRHSGGDHPASDAADGGARRAALLQLLADVTPAKEALSSSHTVVVPVGLPGVIHEVTVGRAELEAAIHPRLRQTVDLLEQTVMRAGLDAATLDRVLLVGGASRMPVVRRLLEERLGVPIALDDHPKYAVCLGAAIAAGSAMRGARPSTPRRHQDPVVSPELSEHPVASGDAPSEAPVVTATLPAEEDRRVDTIVLHVDLEDSGLTESTTVPLEPAVRLRSPAAARPAEALAIDLAVDPTESPSRQMLLVVLGVLAVALGVGFWLLLA